MPFVTNYKTSFVPHRTIRSTIQYFTKDDNLRTEYCYGRRLKNILEKGEPYYNDVCLEVEDEYWHIYQWWNCSVGLNVKLELITYNNPE